MEYLVDALANLHQITVALQVARSLSADQCLRLANESDNSYVQFGCIFQTLSSQQRNRQLSVSETQRLLTLLLKVAEDGPKWLSWMRVFNTHPNQYPLLQNSLGQALANAPDGAIQAYVETIDLRIGIPIADHGRRCVAECLRAFRERATFTRRTLLWCLAHKKWQAWRFDQANPISYLSNINWSVLDYAVMGFAFECMSDVERVKMSEYLRSELQTLDDRWHSSISDILTECNRLLSQLQPYAHVMNTINSGEDWITETRTYSFFDPSKDEYMLRKYGLDRST